MRRLVLRTALLTSDPDWRGRREGAFQLRLGGGGRLLGDKDLTFGSEPVVELVAVLAAAGFVELIGAAADLVF